MGRNELVHYLPIDPAQLQLPRATQRTRSYSSRTSRMEPNAKPAGNGTSRPSSTPRWIRLLPPVASAIAVFDNQQYTASSSPRVTRSYRRTSTSIRRPFCRFRDGSSYLVAEQDVILEFSAEVSSMTLSPHTTSHWMNGKVQERGLSTLTC